MILNDKQENVLRISLAYFLFATQILLHPTCHPQNMIISMYAKPNMQSCCLQNMMYTNTFIYQSIFVYGRSEERRVGKECQP